MKINLIVIRTEHPELLKKQYELLGMEFDYHRHGNGPFHYTNSFNGTTFEIYPFTKSMTKADSNLRLGFDVKNLKELIKGLRNSSWVIKSEITQTKWGLIAVVQDLDGRKIELKNYD